MNSYVSIQLWVNQEEYNKLHEQKTTKRTWREFLLEPLLGTHQGLKSNGADNALDESKQISNDNDPTP